MRVPYSTKLEPNLLKALKIQAIEENRAVNEILEEVITDYLNKKGIKVETKK